MPKPAFSGSQMHENSTKNRIRQSHAVWLLLCGSQQASHARSSCFFQIGRASSSSRLRFSIRSKIESLCLPDSSRFDACSVRVDDLNLVIALWSENQQQQHPGLAVRAAGSSSIASLFHGWPQRQQRRQRQQQQRRRRRRPSAHLAGSLSSPTAFGTHSTDDAGAMAAPSDM